jgi:hypothetical protein
MKRTWKRVSKVRERVAREAILAAEVRVFLGPLRGQGKMASVCAHALQAMAAGALGRWTRAGVRTAGQNRPVLKHGPRSVAPVRVEEWQTFLRSESKGSVRWW